MTGGPVDPDAHFGGWVARIILANDIKISGALESRQGWRDRSHCHRYQPNFVVLGRGK